MLANQIQLDKKIVYTTCSDFYLSDAQKKAEAKKISKVDGVAGVENIEFHQIVTEFKDQKFNLQLLRYDSPTLQKIHYSLEKGAYPKDEEENCVLLPNDFMDKYQVGDVISVYVIDDWTSGDTDEIPIADVTISGFLSSEPVFCVSASGTELKLNDIFVQDSTNYGVIYALVDQEGNDLEPSLSDSFLISTEAGIDVNKVKLSLMDIVNSPAFLHTGENSIALYSESHNMELILMTGYALTAITLAFSMLLANTLLSLLYRQRELAVYFMSGATWKESIRIIVAQQCIPIIFGYLFGTWIYVKSAGSPLFYIVVPEIKWQYFLVALLIELLMYASAVLPFYWMTLHKSPIELFRKD